MNEKKFMICLISVFTFCYMSFFFVSNSYAWGWKRAQNPDDVINFLNGAEGYKYPVKEFEICAVWKGYTDFFIYYNKHNEEQPKGNWHWKIFQTPDNVKGFIENTENPIKEFKICAFQKNNRSEFYVFYQSKYQEINTIIIPTSDTTSPKVMLKIRFRGNELILTSQNNEISREVSLNDVIDLEAVAEDTDGGIKYVGIEISSKIFCESAGSNFAQTLQPNILPIYNSDDKNPGQEAGKTMTVLHTIRISDHQNSCRSGFRFTGMETVIRAKAENFHNLEDYSAFFNLKFSR